MLEYIYFVKCPNCDDEPFHFFDEAKGFAMGCLSQKPIITQVEVNRNDFGECIDSCDLGTVWSWEEMMTKLDPVAAQSTFSKKDLACQDVDNDPEFAALDNSLDSVPDNFRKPSDLAEAYYAVVEVDGKERRFPFNTREEAKEYLNSVRTGKDPAVKGKKLGSMYTESCKKPIPDGMTIDALVEEMEENEDTVECKWCEELFDKSECRYEVSLGWLCDRCQAAIKSRGETLTFREGPVDEAYGHDPFDHHDPDYDEDEAAYALADRIDRVHDERYDSALDSLSESIVETGDTKHVELEYSNLPVTLYGSKRAADDWDELEDRVQHTYRVDADSVVEVIWDLMTDEDAASVPGGLDTLYADDKAFDEFMAKHFDSLFDKYKNQILAHFEEDAIRDYEDHHSLDEHAATKTQVSMLEELEESEDYHKRLTMCPECGDNSFDHETGICINCGFDVIYTLDKADIQ